MTKHLIGLGCPKCSREKCSERQRTQPLTDYEKLNAWSYTKWSLVGAKSKRFESYKVYIVELWDEEERFFKIGKTFEKISNRFARSRLPFYEWRVIKIIESEDAAFISKLEKQMQKYNIQYRYLPRKKFGGHTECFSEIRDGIFDLDKA